MGIDELIQIASERTLRVSEIDQTAIDLGRSAEDVCDLFSRAVAQRYLAGEYSYDLADAAMNSLFSYAIPVSARALPALSWSVYIAFDEGEYREGGETVTRELLAKVPGLIDA